jgi:hypothetical protein
MVPTEEERFPVRVSISVRGLSAVNSLFASLCLIRSSHICIAMVMLHAGLKPERTLSLFFPRQFCSLNFLITFDVFLCTFLGRYWPARECCASRLHDNQ